MIKKITWYIQRLRSMDGREIGYRIRQAAQTKLEAMGFCLTSPHPAAGESGRSWLANSSVFDDVVFYRDAADRILAGSFHVFALRDAKLGFPPDWNRDPKTGTKAPVSFGKQIDYRDESVVGDIKYLWEPNRHTELVTLAQAWRLTGEMRYLEGCRVLLESWFDQCPYPKGAQWVSSLELGVRLANWAATWQLLGGNDAPLFTGELGAAFRRRWLDSIYCHCHFINGYFSLHSSANNHLLGEYMGLLMATLQWPLWPESRQWQSTAREGFAREALLQTFADGVNREQAIWYHHEVADMMLLCGLAARANALEFEPAYWQRLEAMLEFIAALMDRNGHMPMIGDADDAVMVRLSQEPDWCAYRSLLATGAVLFKRADFKQAAGWLDHKSRWLLGADGERIFDALAVQDAPLATPVRQAFVEGGYFVLGRDFGSPEEIKAVFDCGPLGYLSIAAHGHADALSLTLSVAGNEVLIDPGTYAYHTQESWRNYFRSTFAHNTVCIDGSNQSEIGGNFLWLEKAQATVDACELGALMPYVRGHHDGYRRLQDPVTHAREVRFDASRNLFEVIDTLTCNAPHHVSLSWNVAESCTAQLEDGDAVIHSAGAMVRLSLDAMTFSAELLQGCEQPPAGWVSRRFDTRRPCPLLVWRGRIDAPIRLVTTISITLKPR